MPWKEVTAVNERMHFILRLENGERMSDLCTELGISRKTGYKFLDRYRQMGPKGLYDASRRPNKFGHQTPFGIQKLILDLKQDKPLWGAAKIKEILERRHPGFKIPARSTVHEILDGHGYVLRRSKRKRCRAVPTALGDAQEPNALWCADFKGQFQMQNKTYCYPLTVTDYRSRFLLGCEGLESTKSETAKTAFELVFKEYGLPAAIRTDNGVPFSSRSLFGLSRLSVWWMRLGIALERIEPGHPEQNGRHERMHLTLKQAVTQPAGKNFLHQQEKHDAFREEFNTQRPHEALGMKCPAEIYRPSPRVYCPELTPIEYPNHDLVRSVSDTGKVRFKGSAKYFFLSAALAGQKIGLEREEDGIWRISFMEMDLGFLDESNMQFSPVQQQSSTPLS